MATQPTGMGMEAGQQQSQAGPGTMPDEFTQYYLALQRCIGEYPTASLIAGFGGGFGLGMLLIGSMRKSARTALRGTAHAYEGSDYELVAERLGRAVLDAVASALPEALQSQLQSEMTDSR